MCCFFPLCSFLRIFAWKWSLCLFRVLRSSSLFIAWSHHQLCIKSKSSSLSNPKWWYFCSLWTKLMKVFGKKLKMQFSVWSWLWKVDKVLQCGIFLGKTLPRSVKYHLWPRIWLLRPGDPLWGLRTASKKWDSLDKTPKAPLPTGGPTWKQKC